MLIYVDDLFVTGNDNNLIEKIRADSQNYFKFFFLKIEFARSDKGIYMCKRKYTLELIAELGLNGSKPSTTPLEVNKKLTLVEFDNAVKNR